MSVQHIWHQHRIDPLLQFLLCISHEALLQKLLQLKWILKKIITQRMVGINGWLKVSIGIAIFIFLRTIYS
jgi:hypothetical protein